MRYFWHRFWQFIRFYILADTRFQVHSPLVYGLANALFKDDRWFYAFRDIEAIRSNMLKSSVALDIADYGSGSIGLAPIQRRVSLRRMARVAASSPAQGRRLFRLALWARPERMLELGTSVGIGAMYLASAARQARFITLEGSETCAHVARANLGILSLNHQVEVIDGVFQETLQQALTDLEQIDLAFFDGHHRKMPTLEYFEEVLRFTHDRSILVFDDIYWSPEMTVAWERIQQHPRVTLTVDLFDLGLVFLNPDIKVKQHFRLAPAAWKPWKMW